MAVYRGRSGLCAEHFGVHDSHIMGLAHYDRARGIGGSEEVSRAVVSVYNFVVGECHIARGTKEESRPRNMLNGILKQEDVLIHGDIRASTFVIQPVRQKAGDHHSAGAEPMRRKGSIGVSGEGAGV